jgi:rare lipoprotein A
MSTRLLRSEPTARTPGHFGRSSTCAAIRTLRSAIVGLSVVLAAGCSVMQPQEPRLEPPPAQPAAEPAPSPAPPPPEPPAPTPEPAPVPADPWLPLPSGAKPRLEDIPRGSPNVPYIVNGDRYVPANADVAMNEVGIASWYGKPFHGRKTANGERYDMHGMTAAHKTMPLPSYAVVRNRENGKEIVVRINDRGPFKRGRIIDLSYAAAKALDIAGLATVEVVRLTREAIRLGMWRRPGGDNAKVAKAEAQLRRPG